MHIFDLFKKKKPSLLEDIKKSYDWIALALNSSGYNADFTIESLKDIDRFFDEHSENGKPKSGGLLSEDLGQRLFAIGSYVGEVILRNTNGSWIVNNDDPAGELNISVKFEDTIIFPVQRVMKRMENGKEDDIYTYGKELTS